MATSNKLLIDVGIQGLGEIKSLHSSITSLIQTVKDMSAQLTKQLNSVNEKFDKTSKHIKSVNDSIKALSTSNMFGGNIKAVDAFSKSVTQAKKDLQDLNKYVSQSKAFSGIAGQVMEKKHANDLAMVNALLNKEKEILGVTHQKRMEELYIRNIIAAQIADKAKQNQANLNAQLYGHKKGIIQLTEEEKRKTYELTTLAALRIKKEMQLLSIKERQSKLESTTLGTIAGLRQGAGYVASASPKHRSILPMLNQNLTEIENNLKAGRITYAQANAQVEQLRQGFYKVSAQAKRTGSDFNHTRNHTRNLYLEMEKFNYHLWNIRRAFVWVSWAAGTLMATLGVTTFFKAITENAKTLESRLLSLRTMYGSLSHSLSIYQKAWEQAHQTPFDVDNFLEGYNKINLTLRGLVARTKEESAKIQKAISDPFAKTLKSGRSLMDLMTDMALVGKKDIDYTMQSVAQGMKGQWRNLMTEFGIQKIGGNENLRGWDLVEYLDQQAQFQGAMAVFASSFDVIIGKLKDLFDLALKGFAGVQAGVTTVTYGIGTELKRALSGLLDLFETLRTSNAIDLGFEKMGSPLSQRTVGFGQNLATPSYQYIRNQRDRLIALYKEFNGSYTQSGFEKLFNADKLQGFSANLKELNKYPKEFREEVEKVLYPLGVFETITRGIGWSLGNVMRMFIPNFKSFRDSIKGLVRDLYLLMREPTRTIAPYISWLYLQKLKVEDFIESVSKGLHQGLLPGFMILETTLRGIVESLRIMDTIVRGVYNPFAKLLTGGKSEDLQQWGGLSVVAGLLGSFAMLNFSLKAFGKLISLITFGAAGKGAKYLWQNRYEGKTIPTLMREGMSGKKEEFLRVPFTKPAIPPNQAVVGDIKKFIVSENVLDVTKLKSSGKLGLKDMEMLRSYFVGNDAEIKQAIKELAKENKKAFKFPKFGKLPLFGAITAGILLTPAISQAMENRQQGKPQQGLSFMDKLLLMFTSLGGVFMLLKRIDPVSMLGNLFKVFSRGFNILTVLDIGSQIGFWLGKQFDKGINFILGKYSYTFWEMLFNEGLVGGLMSSMVGLLSLFYAGFKTISNGITLGFDIVSGLITGLLTGSWDSVGSAWDKFVTAMDEDLQMVYEVWKSLVPNWISFVPSVLMDEVTKLKSMLYDIIPEPIKKWYETNFTSSGGLLDLAADAYGSAFLNPTMAKGYSQSVIEGARNQQLLREHQNKVSALTNTEAQYNFIPPIPTSNNTSSTQSNNYTVHITVPGANKITTVRGAEAKDVSEGIINWAQKTGKF